MGGSTNLGDGWLTGYKEAALSAQDSITNISILLTYGRRMLLNPDLLVYRVNQKEKGELSGMQYKTPIWCLFEAQDPQRTGGWADFESTLLVKT
jgi:hypothetical protein